MTRRRAHLVALAVAAPAVAVGFEWAPAAIAALALAPLAVELGAAAGRREQREAELQAADLDALTGLYTRGRFEAELRRHLAERRRYGVEGAVLVLDLDNLKYVNDTLGHSAGDELIRGAARLLAGRLRETDVAARLYGDEFAVLLKRVGADAAEAVARDLVERIGSEVAVASGARRVRPSASVGVAPISEEIGSVEDALARADVAMYQAKQGGKDRAFVYRPSGHEELMVGRVMWAERLRRALQDDGFVLFVQPIVDVPQRVAAQYEVLLRMAGQDGEVFEPDSFLPVADHFRMMGAVDRWVVREAIALAGRMDGARLEINLSARSLDEEGLFESIRHELAEQGVDGSRIIFEITETAAITNLERAGRFMRQVRELGASFALDDFGSGFGSWFYLKRLDFDYLKIDGEFVRSLPQSKTDQLVVRSIVETARGLGKRTIAEYVEDEETIALLAEWGVDFAQGHHFGRAAPPEFFSVRERV